MEFAVNSYDQELIDAAINFKFEEVRRILKEKEPVATDTLSECLLLCIQQICQKNINIENNEESCTTTSFKTECDIIYILLSAGADVDKTDQEGNTGLFYAAMKKNHQLCGILLQCGADMWSPTEHGVSIYDYVSKNNTSQNVINVFNEYYPGLWKAVESENIYQVRKLINYWCRTSLQKEGLSLKDIALQTGNEEIINLIFGVYESMDLIYHVYAKNTEAVKKMLETCKSRLRLNLRKMGDHGAPILYYLIQSRNVPIIELFIKHDCQIYTIMRDQEGNDMPVLFSALKPDMSVDVIEALVPKSKRLMEDILYKILYMGKTVLEVAMEKNVSPSIFAILIDRGGPLLLCDRNQLNETVLDVAISHNKKAYIDVIDQCVYEWIHNSKDFKGRRLKLALLGWRFEPVQYMGDDLNDSISKFLTDINLLQAHIEEMSITIENGDVQKFSELKEAVYSSKLCESNMLWHARILGDGLPLLHQAVLFNQPEIVEMILDDKPQKESIDNLFDQHHRTALHYAFASSSTKEIQKLLLNSGCSEHVLDKGNREPLDFKEKQDTSALLELIDRLKYRNYLECEPDPWKIDAFDADPENVGSYSSSEEDYELYENVSHESADSEYDDLTEEAASQDERQSPSQCIIL